MNDRIKDLAEESGMTQYVAENNKYLERFAEMIVNECVDQLTKEWYRINNLPPFENETPRDVGMRVGAKSEVLRMVAVINDHFGVNE